MLRSVFESKRKQRVPMRSTDVCVWCRESINKHWCTGFILRCARLHSSADTLACGSALVCVCSLVIRQPSHTSLEVPVWWADCSSDGWTLAESTHSAPSWHTCLGRYPVSTLTKDVPRKHTLNKSHLRTHMNARILRPHQTRAGTRHDSSEWLTGQEQVPSESSAQCQSQGAGQ